MSGSEEHGGGGKSLSRWGIAGLLVLGLLLAGNLAVAMWDKPDEGEPQGFLTPDLLRGAGLWAAVGVIALSSGYGLFCAEKLKERREARGVGWMRGSFVFGLVGVTGLAIATFEPETFQRADIILLALWVYAIQMLMASRQAAHQAGRTTTTPRKRKRKPAPSGSHGSAPPAAEGGSGSH